MIMRSLLVFLLAAGASHSAFAGPVEVQSIQVVPAESTVGRHPEITGSIRASKKLARGEAVQITVIAVVVRPDRIMRSWTWKNIRMRSGDIRSFVIPKEYEMKLAGTYRVDFNVYSRDMLPMHRLSKTFVAVDRAFPPTKAITPLPEDNKKPVEPAARQAENPHFGAGLYADTLHSSGGATMFLRPFKYLGLQATYTGGSFTIAEGRILARFPFSSGITPYLGAGFVNVSTERSVEIIDIKTRFEDSGMSGVIGVEIPLGKRGFGSFEISGSSIDLKKEVSNGSITGTASVDYSPVTFGVSIGYYLF